MDTLLEVLDLAEIMRLISATARWVHPETFKLLPVWWPEHYRGSVFYKKNWSEPQGKRRTDEVEAGTRGSLRTEGNSNANSALKAALGIASLKPKDWSCCHLWGVDDGTSNFVVRDRRFYSCLANMVLLPTPLKAFTDTISQVKAMLRTCAFYTYDWRCAHEGLPECDLDVWAGHPAYPTDWPVASGERLPPGTVPLSTQIRAAAERRLARIRSDLQTAGPYYPREQVMEVLRYYAIPAQD